MSVTFPGYMFTIDIKKELSANQFILLDCSIDDNYKKWLVKRNTLLKKEYEKRLKNQERMR